MTPPELASRINRLGLTQTEAARRLGLTQPELSRWVNGRVKITARRAVWLDQGLKCLEEGRVGGSV